METKSKTFQAVDREQLADQVISQLRAGLASGTFRVGEKLPAVPELMVHFSVGRTTIREAVRALVYAGFLQVRQGDGTYVRSLTPGIESLGIRLARAKVQEVYELRRVLELEMVRLACERRTESDLKRMAGALRRMKRTVDPGLEVEFLAADIDFHIAVAMATHNSVLAQLYNNFAPGLRQALSHVVALPKVVQYCLASKILVHEAIAKGDAELARRLTERHLDDASARIELLIAAESRSLSNGAASDAAEYRIGNAT